MKIPNKQELQQTAFNHSSDIDFQDFMNLYKKYTAKPYSFLLIDATLASDNPLRFRENLVERIQKLIMTTDDKIRDDINCNMILTVKQQKYQHYLLEKLINMNILQLKKYSLLIKNEYKLSLLILLSVKRLKKKKKNLRSRRKTNKSNWRSWKTIDWI